MIGKHINSTETFVHEVFDFHFEDDEVLYFRGHSDQTYLLKPSVFREDKLRLNEHNLYSELIAARPESFLTDSSTFEQLVRMQHQSLPTRLLDITSNPLMALFFASEKHPDKNGEVVFFRIKRKLVRYFDSDTVSCIANLCRLDEDEKSSIDLTIPRKTFCEQEPIPRLLHFIKKEKPYFKDCIDPADLPSILCVRTKMSNERISAQSGAFLLFGLNAKLDELGDADIAVERFVVPGSAKKQILCELDRLNINISSVYPSIDNAAKAITEKYLNGFRAP